MAGGNSTRERVFRAKKSGLAAALGGCGSRYGHDSSGVQRDSEHESPGGGGGRSKAVALSLVCRGPWCHVSLAGSDRYASFAGKVRANSLSRWTPGRFAGSCPLVAEEARDLDWLRRQLIIALAADNELFELLVFKGGNALALAHGVGMRASLELDYFLAHEAPSDAALGERLRAALSAHLSKHGLTVFDWTFGPHPKGQQGVPCHELSRTGTTWPP